jgi:hypothetical protein
MLVRFGEVVLAQRPGPGAMKIARHLTGVNIKPKSNHRLPPKKLRCPMWVIRDRVEPAASPAMSAMPLKAVVRYPTATQQVRTR